MREDAPHRPGPAVRGYRVERHIGTGGAAAVYEARRLVAGGPGERVACKVVHAEQRGEPQHREQARQEAVLGLRVTAGHPNLVEILDFFDDAQARHCIVMELVDGASVADLRGPDRRLPFPVIRRVAVEVLEALAYLHGRGVLHRDLSPRNILVTAGGAVKVTDLGIARVMEQGLVHTETVRGTAMYVPREAIELLPLDARADLFSLGAILYELVTGTPPCGHQELVSVMFARTAIGKFAPLPPETPADLAQLITGLLPPERDERRPQTAVEALALLRGHGLPMASADELAGMVAPAQARRDQELERERPESVLPPGHVLAPRDALEAAEAQAARMAGRGAGVQPRLIVGDAADAVPHHVSDPLPEGMAERVPERVIDAVVERVADAAPGRGAGVVPGRVPGAVPRRVTRLVPGASEGVDHGHLRGARRSVAGRALLVAAIVMCALVPAVLLDDGFHGEQAAVTLVPSHEAPAPVVVPAPAPPISPVVVTPVPAREPTRRTAERADEPRRERIEVQRRSQRAAARQRVRVYVPPASEVPAWGRR